MIIEDEKIKTWKDEAKHKVKHEGSARKDWRAKTQENEQKSTHEEEEH